MAARNRATKRNKMLEHKTSNIEKIAKINQNDQIKLINYFSRCHEGARVQIFDYHRDNLHKLRLPYKDEASLSEISYCAFLLAVGFARSKEKSLTKKSFVDLTLDEIRELSASRAIAFAKKSVKFTGKHEKLMGYWAIVRTLRLDHGYSYARITEYLKKKHRFSIASSSIFKKWKEIEIANKMEVQK